MTGDQIRRLVLRESHRAGVGHIGSALSVADLLAALYGSALQVSDPDDPERDRFILSKGHAGLALYCALHLRGWLSEAELAGFCTEGGHLGVHPEASLRGVDFSTGSLGMGLSMAAGAALGARLRGSPRRVFALLSDAECNAGATWEAVMFAAHHRLGNLVAIVDDNGQQAFGHTREVLALEPLEERFAAFGWRALAGNGHDQAGLAGLLGGLGRDQGPPTVLVARTILGKGVPYMEGQIRWHYLPIDDEQYRLALAGLEAP